MDFISSLRKEEARKIYYILDMLKGVFFIFDDGNIVILFNGFQKKTQKTPPSEIEKALKIKEEYYESKK